ncbi:drug/metabolite transporter (DMT)-like permease [Aurantimicrobium minutum]|uniref:DMT family transporter n=1 Tax=Aurantimicrobium minutum TaxID=708131 RepID=UPI0024758B0D|nr:DMT family transporter [Aurantimicrobium minutum]MDH6532651.1 drug/metabolite transporter (DMT)-like permease [Aurantimicrobium minutum]
MAKQSMKYAGLLFGFIGIASFSLSLPMTKLALHGFPPLFLGAGRAVVAAVIAALVLLITRSALPQGTQWFRLVVVALGVVVGFPFFTSYALQYVPASHGAVMIGLLPAATAVVAVLRGKERPSKVFWVAAVMGALAVGVFAIMTTGTESGPALGDLFLVAAVVLAAIGYGEGGLLSREIGSWQTISWALVVALPVMVPLAWTSVADLNWTAVPGLAWLGFGYISVISMYLGFFAWYRGLAIGPMASVSQIQLLQPVLTIVWSALFFAEIVGPSVWIAAAAVIACAGIAVRARVKTLAITR